MSLCFIYLYTNNSSGSYASGSVQPVHTVPCGDHPRSGQKCIRTGWGCSGGAAGDAKADEFFTLLASYPEGAGADIAGENGPEDLACIFCTSGTTSKPKSVVYNHMSYWLSGLSTLDMLGLDENDRTLEYRSFGWNSAQILSLLPWMQVGADACGQARHVYGITTLLVKQQLRQPCGDRIS